VTKIYGTKIIIFGGSERSSMEQDVIIFDASLESFSVATTVEETIAGNSLTPGD